MGCGKFCSYDQFVWPGHLTGNVGTISVSKKAAKVVVACIYGGLFNRLV